MSVKDQKEAEAEVDIDEQVLFGDITAEVEEQLIDVEIVPEHAAELRKEQDNMKNGQRFLVGRSQQKRSHMTPLVYTSVSKRLRVSLASHEEISIDQSQLRSNRSGPRKSLQVSHKIPRPVHRQSAQSCRRSP